MHVVAGYLTRGRRPNQGDRSFPCRGAHPPRPRRGGGCRRCRRCRRCPGSPRSARSGGRCRSGRGGRRWCGGRHRADCWRARPEQPVPVVAGASPPHPHPVGRAVAQARYRLRAGWRVGLAAAQRYPGHGRVVARGRSVVPYRARGRRGVLHVVADDPGRTGPGEGQLPIARGDPQRHCRPGIVHNGKFQLVLGPQLIQAGRAGRRDQLQDKGLWRVALFPHVRHRSYLDRCLRLPRSEGERLGGQPVIPRSPLPCRPSAP